MCYDMKNRTESKFLEEKMEQKNVQAKYNSVTEKGKVENQNQTHNARKEGSNPITQKK